jgi:protein ImuB
MPEPGFLLEPPLRLALRDHRPHYQGALTLLVGPDRVEGGWWDRLPARAPADAAVETGAGVRDQTAPAFTALVPRDDAAMVAIGHRNVVRDYWIAVNDNAGVVAIFRQPLDDGGSAWFLHGVYA